MLSIALLIAPVFGLMVLGLVLRRGIFESAEFWAIADKLVYWVLMPSLLFYKSSTADFDLSLVRALGSSILLAFAAAAAFSLLASFMLRISGASASSVLQGCARHNTFLALAIAERLYGAEGLAFAALCSAILIPITNLTVVPLIVTLAPSRRKGGLLGAILYDLARNPLIVSIFLGVSTNLLIGKEIPVLHDMTRILGNATLPIVLLVVGASLRSSSGVIRIAPIITAALGKFLVFPLVAFFCAQWMGLTDMQTMIVVIFASVPSASSSYTLAKQLGGDAPLMANIVASHTALAFAIVPMILAMVQWMLASI